MGVILGINVRWPTCRLAFIEDPTRSASGRLDVAEYSYDAFLDRTLRGVRLLLNSERHTREVAAIGITVPGRVVNGYIVRSGHFLQHLLNQPLAADFSRALDGAAAVVVDEAKAAILGRDGKPRIIVPDDPNCQLGGTLMSAQRLLLQGKPCQA